MAGGLQSDQLFLGLTRPAQVMGVHYLIFLINFMGCTLIFINLTVNKIPITVLVFLSVHLLAYLVCLREPRMVELVIVRYGKCARCKNRLHHKQTNSYDLV